MTPRRAEDLPPDLLDALQSIPAGKNLTGYERRKAVKSSFRVSAMPPWLMIKGDRS